MPNLKKIERTITEFNKDYLKTPIGRLLDNIRIYNVSVAEYNKIKTQRIPGRSFSLSELRSMQRDLLLRIIGSIFPIVEAIIDNKDEKILESAINFFGLIIDDTMEESGITNGPKGDLQISTYIVELAKPVGERNLLEIPYARLPEPDSAPPRSSVAELKAQAEEVEINRIRIEELQKIKEDIRPIRFSEGVLFDEILQEATIIANTKVEKLSPQYKLNNIDKVKTFYEYLRREINRIIINRIEASTQVPRQAAPFPFEFNINDELAAAPALTTIIDIQDEEDLTPEQIESIQIEYSQRYLSKLKCFNCNQYEVTHSLFPCGHLFCRRCITGLNARLINNEQVQCPRCHRNINIIHKIFFQKYMKYKTKYLKLKEQLN